MTELRITVTNTSPTGGTFLTPFWFGLHDEGFDLFERGQAASAGLERLAEDGTFATIRDELMAADADGQGGVITGARGPIATGETTFFDVTANGDLTQFISLAAMVLPSNDAFVGTNDGVRLFDDSGMFLGPQTITFLGENVYDAGTELNTELDAAFINQTGPNTGVDEGGVVRLHAGFNGSEGAPTGEGDQIILGGMNAFGESIVPSIADFTRAGATIATISIEEIAVVNGTSANDTDLAVTDFAAPLIIDGGAGSDTVTVAANFSDLAFSRVDKGFFATPTSGETLEFRSVERIQLNDRALEVQTGATVETVGLLYKIGLGRDADIAGQSFWNEQVEAGLDLTAISDLFIGSSEFGDRFSDGSDTIAFVQEFYQNALGRDADAAGQTFWANQLGSDSFDEGDLLLAFAEAQETRDLNAEAFDDGFLLFA